MLAIYFNAYNELSDAKRYKKHKYNPKKWFLETYNYDVSFENEKLSDTARKCNKK